MYLHHYILPHIIENCPDTLVLHVGTNSIHNKDKGAEKIAKEVIEAGLTAKSLGVKNIVISGLVVRKNGMVAERKRKGVNNIIKAKCDFNSFYFVDNDNIVMDDICEDGVHLLAKQDQ